MITLLPIIILFIVAFLIVRLLFPIRFKALSARRFYQLIAVYIAVGFMAICIFPYLPNAQHIALSDREVEEKLEEKRYILEQLNEKRVEEVTAYLQEQWTFTATQNEVVLDNNNEQGFSMMRLIIEWRDDAASNEIYASYYQLPYAYAGMDMTNYFITPQLSFANDVLSIVEIENRVTYNRVIPDLWLLQEHYEDHGWEDSSQILYLNVPKHINIVDKSGMIYNIH